jgi:hypothetical protein
MTTSGRDLTFEAADLTCSNRCKADDGLEQQVS